SSVRRREARFGSAPAALGHAEIRASERGKEFLERVGPRRIGIHVPDLQRQRGLLVTLRRMDVILVALAVIAIQAGAATASLAAAAKRYEFAFQARAKEVRSVSQNSDELTATIDLLMRHGMRPELNFKIVGPLPPDCVAAMRCPDAALLRRRV